MSAEILTGIASLRMILDTETDGDSPVGEITYDQIRKNLEALILLLFGTNITGTVTSITETVMTDSSKSWSADQHNGRTLVFTSGSAKGKAYVIDDTTATTLTCTGDTMVSDGAAIGDDYTILYDIKQNSDGHDHDGANSKGAQVEDGAITTSKIAGNAVTEAKIATNAVTQAKIAAGAVHQAQLATSDSTASTGQGHLILAGGEYAFYPLIRRIDYGAGYSIASITDTTNGVNVGSTYTNYIYVSNDQRSNGAKVEVFRRYVTASGEVHWVFILRDQNTKDIKATYQAPDHPCFGNGGKPLLVPHPFPDFDPAKQEIIVINPTAEQVRAIKEATVVDAEDQPDKAFMEVFLDQYEIDEAGPEAPWPTKAVTVGLPRDWDQAWQSGQPVTTIKKVIPKPGYVQCRNIRQRKGQII